MATFKCGYSRVLNAAKNNVSVASIFAMAALIKRGLRCCVKPRLKRGLRTNGLRPGPSLVRPMAALIKRGLRLWS